MFVMALCTGLLLTFLTLTALGQLAPTIAADNVAVQWNLLVSQFVCTHNMQPTESNFLYLQTALAQWHALLALKDTGACTTDEAVVAYASRALLAAYLPFEEDNTIDPFLDAQLQTLHLTGSQKRLAQSMGEAVALDIVARRLKDPRRTFTYGPTREAVDERENDPTPGLYRFLNYTDNTPSLIIQRSALGQTFVLPNALAYIEENLKHFGPPKVPSPEWNVEYEQLVDIGRDNWKGRTKEMNQTAGFIFGSQQKGSLCRSPVDFWFAIARTVLPPKTSLYDTALLFSKLGVAIHDSRVVLSTLQYGFWYWRPPTAFRAGDANHKPIPNWSQYILWNTHPEYPSGATTISACGNSTDVIGPRHYKSFAAAVEDTKLGRMYAGAHYNISVRHGAELGAKVANYIWKNWGMSTPSGILPASAYLNVVSKQPSKAGEFRPLKLEY
ncbi:hypothetical protein M758_8G170100 [Ceratodon purpureus]|nr:hypothetical protein M758_8G170100 [Ceratodon purpureus]